MLHGGDRTLFSAPKGVRSRPATRGDLQGVRVLPASKKQDAAHVGAILPCLPFSFQLYLFFFESK